MAAATSCTPIEGCGGRGCNSSRCRLLTPACIFNETVFHRSADGFWQPLHGRVRIPWNSHHQINYAELNRINERTGAQLTSIMDLAPKQDSACEPPLSFVPVWSLNYADTMYSSLVPLIELDALHLIQANRTLLLPDPLLKHMHPKCRSNTNGPCHTPEWFRTLLTLLSPLQFTHQLSPSCGHGDLSRCPKPVCFSHLRFCSLRSMFDARPKGLDVWTSVQRLVTVQANEAHGEPAQSSIIRVLIERRFSKGMKGRSLANLDELLSRCSQDASLACTTHTFGAAGLAADMRAVRAADVLVGLHGAGLANAWFMRRRSVVVEVRPYGFDGSWPDSYFRSPIRAVSPPRIFHLTVAIGAPELCRPNRGFAITISDALSARACTLPWATLRHALRIVRWWRDGDRGSETPESRYVSGSWASKTIVAYATENEGSGASTQAGEASGKTA